MSKYKPTTAKYRGGAKTYYLVYETDHRYRGGKKKPRIRVKRVYISGRNPKMKGPGTYKNRKGRRVFGVKITYENPSRGRGGRRTVTVTKVVPLPRGARKVRLRRTSKGLRGPLMDIT